MGRPVSKCDDEYIIRYDFFIEIKIKIYIHNDALLCFGLDLSAQIVVVIRCTFLSALVLGVLVRYFYELNIDCPYIYT